MSTSSYAAKWLIRTLRSIGVSLNKEGSALRLTNAHDLTKEDIALIKECKPAILAELHREMLENTRETHTSE